MGEELPPFQPMTLPSGFIANSPSLPAKTLVTPVATEAGVACRFPLTSTDTTVPAASGHGLFTSEGEETPQSVVCLG